MNKTEPRELCDAKKDGKLCVFYKGHAGPHRVIPRGYCDSSMPGIRWIEFLATLLLLVGCGGADFSSAALEVQADAGQDRGSVHSEGGSGADSIHVDARGLGDGGTTLDSTYDASPESNCSPSTSCADQGFACGQVFDGCEEVTCPTAYQVTAYSYDCVNAGLGQVLYLCGGDHSAPAPNDTCTLLPHIVGSTMWCCSQ